MNELYSYTSIVVTCATRRRRRHARAMAGLALVALIATRPAHGQADPFKPVTADDSCEFGLRVTGPAAWDAPEANGPGGWIDFVLRKAVKYCKDGDRFMILHSDINGPMVGWIHDYFSVAALLCRRGDIVEEHPVNSRNQQRHKFSCPISKIEHLKKRLAEGKLLYKYPDDWVDPRPNDLGAMKRGPGSNEPAYVVPPRPAKPDIDCKDPKATHYAERCGIPLLAPAPGKPN